jgi:hypothetical protein
MIHAGNMYSKEYVRSTVLGKKAARKGKFYLVNVIGVLCFVIIAVLIAPVVHELAHLLVLEAFDCYYFIDLKLDAESGMYGFIEPACALSENKEALFYTAGVMTNLLIAALFFLFTSALHMRGLINHSNFFMYIALGFLIDPIFYSFAVEGDAMNALAAIGRPGWMIFVPWIGFILFSMSIAYMYLYLESYIEDNLRIQEEVSEAEAFIKEIRR